MIIIFKRIKILYSELQKVSLNFQEALNKIKSIISWIQQQKNEGNMKTFVQKYLKTHGKTF